MTAIRDVLHPSRLWLVAIVLLGIAAAVLAVPPSGSVVEDGPRGTLALQRFLGALEAGGERADSPPAAGTFLLPADVRSRGQVEELLAWVDRGNRLVVTAGSSTADVLGVESRGVVGGSLTGITSITPDCPELAGVGDVAVRATDRILEVRGTDRSCPSARPYLVELERGAGTIVVLGGVSSLTNEFLDRQDNAPFAVRVLLGSGDGPVHVGPPIPPEATGRGFWATLPPRVRAVLVGVLFAVAVFALVRARRLGLQPDEGDPSPLPQHGLVDATGRLLQAAQDRHYVAGVLQQAARERLRRRLGLPPDTDASTLARLVADRSDHAAAAVERLLRDRTVGSDAELVALSQQLESLTGSLEAPTAPVPSDRDTPSPTTRTADV